MRAVYFFSLIATLRFVACQGESSDSNAFQPAFIYPPPANAIDEDLPTFEIGETVQLRWSANFDPISIGLRHISDKIILLGENAVQGSILNLQPNKNATAWKVAVKGGINKNDPTYYLAALSEFSSSYFTSNYFKIKKSSSVTNSVTTTSSRTSTSTNPPTPTNANAQTGPTQPTPPPQPTPVQPGNNTGGGGLSTGAKTGLGVAIPLGLIALAAAAFFLYRRLKKRREMKNATELPTSSDAGEGGFGQGQAGGFNGGVAGGANGYYAPGSGNEDAVMKQRQMSELQGQQNGWVHELPTDRSGPHQLP